jgi:general secretion pathway protein I
MRGADCRRPRGFTLLEVLVALLLLSLALVALVRTAALEARALAQLKESTLAQWVAANAIAELRLRVPQPQPGERQGQVELGDRRWRWQMQVMATEEARILRLDVAVYAADGDEQARELPAARLTGFVGR